MPELRWILIAFGLALLAGIYLWGRRGSKGSITSDDSTFRSRPEPAFETSSVYDAQPDEGEPVEDDPHGDMTLARGAIDDGSPSMITPLEGHRRAPWADDAHETTIESAAPRSNRDTHRARIEPTFGEESATAELPVHEAPAATSSRSAASVDAPTLGMSSAPPPRRIERRKIITLRLAAGPERIPGAQLKTALESESLQHGKYDVFHRLDEHGISIFSIASMVEPGTFDLERMTQESYSGVTLFAQLPGPLAGMLAFNELVACSRRLHASLGGTLQDERGVPLTVHRIERIRQEIREFEHRPSGEPSAQRASSAHSPPT